MSHLNMEALARLVDEPPDRLEAAHIDACDACAAMLDRLRQQTAALAKLPAIEPHPAAWSGLERRLAAEGLLRRRVVSPRAARWLRYAATIALLLASGATGAVLEARFGGPRDTASVATAGPPMTAPEASERLRLSEQAYLTALTDYNRIVAPESSVDAPTRLAALDAIVLTTQAALDRAPADPVINGYHLTALAQREATLKRLAAARDEPWF